MSPPMSGWPCSIMPRWIDAESAPTMADGRGAERDAGQEDPEALQSERRSRQAYRSQSRDSCGTSGNNSTVANLGNAVATRG